MGAAAAKVVQKGSGPWPDLPGSVVGARHIEAGRSSGRMTRFIESCEVVSGSFDLGPLAGRWDFLGRDLIALTCDHLGGT